ncbi:GSCOCT00002618001.2-RA-CDS [Cotesia congregata]|uniref:Odorant receptor n=1 Tax=Cotesia congregata TaxID=51543 RepID=A0A8J2MQI1_COTCN|nr:GSCOCT00002618001.2-RA-CDS [Cotesia congregata]CAG5101715.1 olfactory receptor 35 [Cotesia congregata]
MCGIWSLDSSTPVSLKLLHNISNILGIIALAIFVGTLTADLMGNLNDLLIATDDGCYLAGISVIIFKVYKFHRQHKRIKNLTDATYRPINEFKKSKDSGVKEILETNKFYEDLGFTFFVTLGGFLVIALIFFVPTEDGALPIRALYPFNTTVSPMHELAFTLQIYAVSYGLMAILMMDTVGLGIMRWLHVQCIILAANYKNCRLDNQSTYLKCQENSDVIRTFSTFDEQDKEITGSTDCFVARFRRCIKNHQRLLYTIDELNACFSSSMLMQLFASFSMICLTGFQAVLGATTKTSLMKFVLYLGAAFSQLLYWCWFGNELLYERMTLLSSQWMSGWENELGSNIQPLLIVSMIQTMRPLELHAGPFFTMSMETFISIIKSSYSFFALLTTMTD